VTAMMTLDALEFASEMEIALEESISELAL
jgi:hypothetical protein